MRVLFNLIGVVGVAVLAACSQGNALKGDWVMSQGAASVQYAHFDDKTASGMLVAKAAMESGVSQGLDVMKESLPYTYQEEGDTIKITFDRGGKKFSTSVRKLAGDKLSFTVMGMPLTIQKAK